MLSRLLTSSTTLVSSLKFFWKYPNRTYKTMTREFTGGCIVKVENDGRMKLDNEKDLLAAIPSNIHGYNCIGLMIDPSIFSHQNEDSMLELLTPFTHMAAFILKPYSKKIKMNEKTILSKIKGKIPDASDKKNIKVYGLGNIKGQDFTTLTRFHDEKYFYNRLLEIPKQRYEMRFFIFLRIDVITNHQRKFIKKIEEEVKSYKSINKIYDRQTDSCIHPILTIYGGLKSEEYPSIIPQQGGIDVMRALLAENETISDEFEDAALDIGLSAPPLESEIYFKNLTNRDNLKLNETKRKPNG